VRLLYFTRGYTAHDVRFLERLSREDLEVGYLPLEPHGEPRDRRPLPRGIRGLAWPETAGPFAWHRLPRFARAFRQVVSSFRPDVVHAGPVQQSALVTAIAGVRPLVTMSWGSDLLMGARGGPGKWAARFALARSTLFLCDCQTVSRAAQGLGMPEDRIVVFPWGVDLRRFSPGRSTDLRRRLGWQTSTVLLSARAWEPLYGVDVLLEAFIQAAVHRPELRLLLLGDGSLRQQFLARIAEARMQNRIHLEGRVDENTLPDHFHSADLYVSASHSDGSSVTLLQAMACGLPVIASDIPANGEWVNDSTGWLFRDGDAANLAVTILSAAGPPEVRRARGREARKVAQARADWERNTSILVDAYRLALYLERTKVQHAV
jgi:glycosyltransferase involved in cell wall biosynthesis